MIERTFQTPCGTIHYWISQKAEHSAPQLVFLPGLTADHRLFDRQIEYFEGKYPLFVWDAPGHTASWPFDLTFTLADKAKWLDAILTEEGFDKPVIIGQSMGGYVGQMFAQLFPEKMSGFISIDSAPLQREYVTGMEIWLLKKMGPVYKYYPWKSLLKTGTEGVATTEYGRKLMHDMMMVYDGDQERYAKLAGHGYYMLAEAMEADLPYKIPCPALLICGEKDHAGSCIRYNKAWHQKTGIPIEWIKNAGHNSNTDAPETVNSLIERLISPIWQELSKGTLLIRFHRRAMCMGDDVDNGIYKIQLPGDATLGDLMKTVLYGGNGNDWPCPQNHDGWTIWSNNGPVADVSGDKKNIRYYGPDGSAPLSTLGITWVFGEFMGCDPEIPQRVISFRKSIEQESRWRR